MPEYPSADARHALAVGAYTLTTTLSLFRAGGGTLFGLSQTHNPAVHGTAQTIAGLVVTSLAATLPLGAVSAVM